MFCDQIAFPFRSTSPGDSKKIQLKGKSPPDKGWKEIKLVMEGLLHTRYGKDYKIRSVKYCYDKNTSSLKDIYLAPPPPFTLILERIVFHSRFCFYFHKFQTKFKHLKRFANLLSICTHIWIFTTGDFSKTWLCYVTKTLLIQRVDHDRAHEHVNCMILSQHSRYNNRMPRPVNRFHNYLRSIYFSIHFTEH